MITNSNPTINYIIGIYYSIVHTIFITSIGFILLLSNNITYLSIIAILLILEIAINATFHDCPLNVFELKYSKISGKTNRAYTSFNAGIVYKCYHYYENQLDLIINLCSGILGKIAMLIFFTLCYIHVYNNK